MSCQQRHLAFISDFTKDIEHLSGKSNVVADCLSRTSINNVVLSVDYAAMSNTQADDPDVKAFPIPISGLQIMPFQIHDNAQPLLCDISTGQPRPIVPCCFQRQVFETIHNLVPPGHQSTVKLVPQKIRLAWA